MSFMYPRTITIRRPAAKVGVGVLGYGGLNVANETVIATGIAANIQQERAQGLPEAKLPSDPMRGSTAWKVLFRHPDRNLVKQHDIVIDDAGQRYQVVAPYWNSMGFNMFCNRLEA